MTIQTNKTVGEMVAQDYRLAAVFKKLNIDFCCNGNRSIETVCTEIGYDATILLQELETITNSTAKNNTDFKSWEIDMLATYIETTHHKYVENKIAEIRPYLTKIAGVHGSRHPELFEVNELFNESADDLLQHMKKEEIILFPFIKKMVVMEKDKQIASRPTFGPIENPIALMHQEHDNEGLRFRKIAVLTNNYTVPADGCNTYRVALGLLKEFEDDLHLHIHLENNILFPKAIALEKEVFSN